MQKDKLMKEKEPAQRLTARFGSKRELQETISDRLVYNLKVSDFQAPSLRSKPPLGRKAGVSVGGVRGLKSQRTGMLVVRRCGASATRDDGGLAPWFIDRTILSALSRLNAVGG
jgi:hypothetical protein